MSIHRYPASTAVREVVFRYATDRPPIGLMAAADGADPARLDALQAAVIRRKWQMVPVSVDGKEYLQVSGFETPEQLLLFLKKQEVIKGEPTVLAEPDDHPRRSAGEWLNSYTLKGAGLLNLVGDMTLLGSGLKSGRSREITGGALYTAGAAVLTRYANVKTEHHLRQVAMNTAKFLQEQAGQLPPKCGLAQILKDNKGGPIADAEKFFYRYPAEVMLSAYTLGAVAMLQSGMKEKNAWGVAYGASSVGLKVASLLIPEKKISNADKAKASPIGKFVHWIQEKPLRVFGFGSLVTDTLLGLSALHEFKKNPKQGGYIFKFITSGTYILADLLMAISNKNQSAESTFDEEEQRRIVALVAESLIRQPKDLREPLLQQASGFLATHSEMQGKATDIAAQIREQLAHMEHNPWINRKAQEALASLRGEGR